MLYKGPLFKRLLDWSHGNLSSVKTSIYILGIMAFFYVIGTIFPQGGDIDEYIKAGGRIVFVVRSFELLDIFSSPLFIILSVILTANLFVCTIDRYPALFAKRAYNGSYSPTHSFCLTQDIRVAYGEVARILREDMGFKTCSKDNEWISMEKGFWVHWRPLTWAYHAGIAFCIIGLFLTYLFAYEDYITLRQGVPQAIMPAERGRFAEFFNIQPRPTGFSVMLDKFTTEYVQSPRLKYPKDKPSRLAIGLGWEGLRHEITDDSLFPKDWKSRLRVLKGDLTVLEKEIELNSPLRYNGFTFYQAGFQDTIKIRVNDNPIPLTASTEEEMSVPGLDSPLRFKELRAGTVQRLDNSTEPIVPFTTIRQEDPETKAFADAGRLELGSPLTIDGVRLTLVDFEESSQLSYRFDPGFPLLWWGGLIVLIAMTIRFFGAWHLLAYNIAEKDGIVVLDVYISSKGLLADPEKQMGRLLHQLTKGDLRPLPLPPLS
jgi:hypothetical protein